MSGNTAEVMIRFDSKGDKEVVTNLRKVEGAAVDLGKSTEKSGAAMGQSFRLAKGGLDDLLSAAGGAAVLYGLQRGFMASIDAAEQMSNAMRGLAAVARYSGEGIGQSIQAAGNLSADGLVEVTGTAKSLQNLLSRGFDLQESIAIIERIKDAAAFNRQANLSMSEAVVSATEGLKNENSVLVDNAGVTKNVSVMWKEYADEHNKGAASLTLSEKRQAEYNGIMRETEAQVGNAKLALEGITGTKARLRVEVEQLSVALGNDLAPTYLAVAESINWTLQNAVLPFLGGIEMTGARMGMWSMQVGEVWDWISSGFEGGVDGIEKDLDRLNQVFDEQAMEIARKYEKGVIPIPNIGADSGRRRNDSPAASDQSSIENRIKKEKEIYERLLKENPVQRSWGEIDLTGRNEADALVNSQRLEGKEARRVAAEEEQIEIAERFASLQMSFMSEQELVQSKYMSLKMVADAARSEELISEDEHTAMLKNIAVQRADDLAKIEQERTISQLQIRSKYVAAGQSILDAANTLFHSKSKALFIATRAMASSGAIINGYQAAAAALAPPPLGLGPVAGIPLSKIMLAGGYLNGMAILAQSFTGGGGGGGSAAVSNGGLGDQTPQQAQGSSPAQQSSIPTQKIINIEFHGYTNASDPAGLAREIAAELRKAETDGY